MLETKAVIKNSAGIHCRPSAEIINAVNASEASVTVVAESGTCTCGSVMELLMLGLEFGTPVTLQIEGGDEAAEAVRFKELFETEWDFPNAGSGC